jgi:anti-sigma-K factor RskA
VEVHHQLADQAAAYSLGALSAAERVEFEAHLAVCAVCAAEVRSFAPIGWALALAVSPATPSAKALAGPAWSPALRPLRTLRSLSYALAASIALAIALGGYAAQLRGRVSTLETRLHDATLRADAGERQMADLRRTAFEAQSTVAVLAAPDLVRIDLAGQPAAPSAAARALWSRSRGLVFTATNLPAPPPGRAYQLWVLTAQPAPMSAGMLTIDANGRVAVMIPTPVDMPAPVAMAVTLEPAAGVPSPTGEKYLVGLTH